MDTTKEDSNEQNQRNEFSTEQDTALEERNELTQQCVDTKCHQDSTLHTFNDLETIKKDEHQHEEAVVEEIREAVVEEIEENVGDKIRESIDDSVRLTEDLQNFRVTHDAVREPHNFVWRNCDRFLARVHQLSRNLSYAYDKNESLAKDNKFCQIMVNTMQLNMESLKREMSFVLNDRDIALKECNDYKNRFELMAAENKSRNQLKYGVNKERENHNDLQKRVASLDLFGSFHSEERMNNLDQANQEINRLRKLTDKYKDELYKTLEEAEVSKIRCDWAINERDKLVMDLRKIRTLYDSLRKQCDDVFNKLFNTMSDHDNVAQQNTDNTEEHNGFKEETETQQKKETCSPQFQVVHNQDSLSTDLQDSDTEILNIDLGVVDSNGDFGIDLIGGMDNPLYPNDDAIYISSIKERSIAAKKLRVNDCILKVNSLDCSLISKQLVLETLRTSSSVTLTIRRKKPDCPSKSQAKNYIDHGITLEAGIYIKKIAPGSMADKVGNLDVGDRVLSINKTSMENMNNPKEAMLLLDESADVLTIKALKSVYYTKNSDSEFNSDNLKNYTNGSIQADKESNDLRYQEPKIKEGSCFDVFMAPENDLPIINHNFESYEEEEKEEALSELDSVIDSFTPYPTPVGSPITYHSRRHFKSNVPSDNIDEAAGTSTRRNDRTLIEDQNNSTSFIVKFLIPKEMPGERRQYAAEYNNIETQSKKRNLKDLRPFPGDLRWISIKKSFEPLGIQILCLDNGALFVAAVSKNSVAHSVGLQIGDRLLEVDGVNLRKTTFNFAANVLMHCGNSVTMLVQYTPDEIFNHP